MERTFSQNEIHEIARAIVEKCLPGKRATMIALSGDLGAGKTTLVQELGKALGVKNPMPSPTFVIMRRYPIDARGYKNLIHIDAYRLASYLDLLKLGWEEIVSDPTNLICLEWPERVPELVPRNSCFVSLEHAGQNKRSVILNKI